MPSGGGYGQCGGGLDAFCAQYANAQACEKTLTPRPYASLCGPYSHVYVAHLCSRIVSVRAGENLVDLYFYDESSGQLVAVGASHGAPDGSARCIGGVEGFTIAPSCVPSSNGAGAVDICATDGG